MDNTIDKKAYDEKAFKKLLVGFLKTKPQGATQTEMMVATGLSKDWVELAVRSLLNDFPARLEPNAQQELIYIFDFAEEAPAPLSKQLKKALWKGFTFFFKAWIVLMLFTYLLFYVLVLAVAISLLTRSSSVLEEVLAGLWRALKDVFRMLGKGRSGEILSDDGYLNQIFSYVFGQTRGKVDDLELEKILLQFISQNQGKIIVAEIVKLTGWSVRKAQEEAAQLLANYHGDAEVTDEGVIVYTFADLTNEKANDELVTTKSQQLVLPIWDRPIPHRKMNDNEKNTNNSIMYINAFNWVMSIVGPFILAYILFDDAEMNYLPDWFFTWTMVVPFIYSFLFWLIPTLRRPGVKAENRKIDALNEGNQLLKIIFERVTDRIYRDREVNQLKNAIVPQGQQLIHQDMGKLLDAKAIELEAESNSDAEGMYYTFEQLKLDLQAAKTIRIVN